MLSALKRSLDNFLGRGEAAVTVPVLDGPLKPNQKLEEAPRIASAEALDNLTRSGEAVLFTSGSALHRLCSGELRRFAATVTCLAASPGGLVAAGLETGGIVVGEGVVLGQAELSCPTAAVFLDEDTLVVANGSAERRASDWRRDLMSLGRSGSLWKLDLKSGRLERLADGLAWPGGVAAGPQGQLFVSETWRHRVLAVQPGSRRRPEPALFSLPAYPGRIVPASGGGYWLTFVSVRNQLVDFILREHGYRKRMMAEVAEPFWVAPAFSSNLSFEEPLQGSRLKQMGILKPWAATLSYGLVARCDEAMQPVFSYHSRADGRMHGVTSVVEDGADLLVGARGPGALIRLEGAAARPIARAVQ